MSNVDYQYDLNGLLIGKGTPYKVINIDGLFELPDVLSDDEPRPSVDGERSSNMETLAGRTISMDITMLTDEVPGKTADDLYDALQRVTSSIRTTFPFKIKRPGFPERSVDVKIRRRAFPANYDFSNGMAAGAIQLKALDPRIYASDLSVGGPVGLSTVIGGLVFPHTVPFDFSSGGVYGIISAFNAGSYETAAVLTVSGGSVTNFTIEHLELGKVLAFTTALASPDSMIVDLGKKTAMLNGIANRRNIMTTAQWFMLRPGNNSIRFNGTLVSGVPQLSAIWRNAWV
jgi:hypothetical protein